MGKSKGALQILFERSWIDPKLIGEYSANGKKKKDKSIPTPSIPITSYPQGATITSDPQGATDSSCNTRKPQGETSTSVGLDSVDPTGCAFSIRKIMKLQMDFMQELTLLQYLVIQMGANIDRTPKCHPEMAGEGVEYAWALAKLKYRRSPIAYKRNKEKFRNLVDL